MKANDAEGGALRFRAGQFGLEPLELFGGLEGGGFAVEKDKATVAVIEREPGLVARQAAVGVGQGMFAVVIAPRKHHRSGLRTVQMLQRLEPVVVPLGEGVAAV